MRRSLGKSAFAKSRLMRFRDALSERTFPLLRCIKPVRERVRIGERNDHVEREHVARYTFAKPYCEGRRVADIACGTGYGMQILSDAAAAVEGYDKESLCGNAIIDLEKESWAKDYDVIVSFETIEHLANPEFFLENARQTTNLLIISSPIGEFRGYNPHHKQVWNLEQFKALLEKRFRCSYFYQTGEAIHDRPIPPVRFVVAIGTRIPPAEKSISANYQTSRVS